MSWVSIKTEYGVVKVDLEDFKSLPANFRFVFDKDRYPLIYFFCVDLRKESNFRLHRWVMNEPKGLLIDHINGDKLDARKGNLRAVTAKQNSHNQGKKKHRGGKPLSSQYIGVCFDKKLGKWQAQIKTDGKSIYLGQFLTEEDAAKTYDAECLKTRGEYARLNFNN